MSLSNSLLYILFCFIIFLHFLQSRKLEKRLSPIEIPSKEAQIKTNNLEIIQSTPNNIAGNDLKSQSVDNSPLQQDGLEYDSLDDIQYIDNDGSAGSLTRGKKHIKQWDHWGKWSECSVSCGVGKMTRWRHCISPGCAKGEKEAQIKTCTLKPCA